MQRYKIGFGSAVSLISFKLCFMCGPIPCGLVRGFDKGGMNTRGEDTQILFFYLNFYDHEMQTAGDKFTCNGFLSG